MGKIEPRAPNPQPSHCADCVIQISDSEMYLYSAFADKVERNCHFPVPGWNCMTNRQAQQSIPSTRQVSLHENKFKAI
jgi:hypothetical protein